MPVISIIVPVYNVEQYLVKCLDSIKEQTFNDWEAILVDDGSTDKSSDICDMYQEKDKRFKVVHKENGGLSDARNKGLELACGKYILFLDSDDYILPDMLFKMNLATGGADDIVVVMDTLLVWEDRTNRQRLKQYGVISREEAILRLFDGRLPNYAAGKLFAKKLWTEFWFPVGKTFEDISTIYKVVNKCSQLILLNDIGYCYVQRKGSITDRAIENRMDAIDAYEEQLVFARENFVSAVPFLEYRVEETKARYVVLKMYKKESWKKTKKALVSYRKWGWKHFILVVSGKLEPNDMIRTISILLVMICPHLYAEVYMRYVLRKNESKK